MFAERKKGRVHDNNHAISLATNNKSVTLQIFNTVQEKQNYHITSRSSKLS